VRGDTNYLETAWVSSKDEVPKQQFSWEAAAQLEGSAPAKGRWRKVGGASFRRSGPGCRCSWRRPNADPSAAAGAL
jgi:hypothetical protein